MGMKKIKERIKKAREWEDMIVKFDKQLEDIGFQFNPKTTKILRLKNLLFLSSDSKPTSREKKKFRNFRKKVKNGKLERKKFKELYGGWVAHTNKGNSYKLIRYMDKFYKELWRE